MVTVSVIIPCYNHGKYIDDALSNLNELPQQYRYEIIIVNDGSTDDFTNRKLKELSAEYTVIFQKNKGLSGARNTGIGKATGKYILPLDADNKIRPDYVLQGVEIMEAEPNIAVVYGNSMLFGEENGLRKSYPFNLQRLMLGNFIDACAIYRKEVWEGTGGYDTNMRDGHEDWEYWLHAAFKGYKFQYVDEVLFDYRVLHTSMVHQLNAHKKKGDGVMDYIVAKHPYYYGPHYIDAYFVSKAKKSLLGFGGKVILKSSFPKIFSSLVNRGKLRKYL